MFFIFIDRKPIRREVVFILKFCFDIGVVLITEKQPFETSIFKMGFQKCVKTDPFQDASRRMLKVGNPCVCCVLTRRNNHNGVNLL